MKPSTWLSVRNNLISSLKSVDQEITTTLTFQHSKRAVARLRELFDERNRIAEELWEFKVDVEPHPAIKQAKGT